MGGSGVPCAGADRYEHVAVTSLGVDDDERARFTGRAGPLHPGWHERRETRAEENPLDVTRFSRCRGLASFSDASSVVDCVKQDRCQQPAAIGRHEQLANEPERQTLRRPGNTAGPPRLVEGPPWLRIDHSQAWAVTGSAQAASFGQILGGSHEQD